MWHNGGDNKTHSERKIEIEIVRKAATYSSDAGLNTVDVLFSKIEAVQLAEKYSKTIDEVILHVLIMFLPHICGAWNYSFDLNHNKI